MEAIVEGVWVEAMACFAEVGVRVFLYADEGFSFIDVIFDVGFEGFEFVFEMMEEFHIEGTCSGHVGIEMGKCCCGKSDGSS